MSDKFSETFDEFAEQMIEHHGGLKAFGEWVAQRADSDELLKEWLRPLYEADLKRIDARIEEMKVEAFNDCSAR